MIFQVINILNNRQKLNLLILVFLMLIASFLELLGLGFVLIILNSFLGLDTVYLETINSYTKNFFEIDLNSTQIITIIILLFTIKFLILILAALMHSHFLAQFRQKISNKLYFNFINRDVKNLISKNSAEYIRNFTEEILTCTTYVNSFLRTALDSILILTFLIFLIYFNPIITLIVFTFFFLLALVYFSLVKNRLSNWAIIKLENTKKKIQFISESFSAIKTIKILSRESFFFDRFKKQIKSLNTIHFKVNFLGELPRIFFEYVLFISILFLFFYLIRNDYETKNIIQLISIYTLTAFRVVPVIYRLLGYLQKIKSSSPSIKKLAVENKKKIIFKNKKIIKINFKKIINLDIKKFYFAKNGDYLFKDLNIEIKKNSQVGIIGESGSGKSTIVDILCGFQKNKYSKLKVDGEDIFKTNNLENWQSSIGYVPQNIFILDQSLRNNILFGADKKYFDDNFLKKIIKDVGLEDFFQKSGEKLSKILKEDGLNISGGEKQRIGIARALLHNPNLIILDEATNGLDVVTENKILNSIKKLKKTTIIVSHRFNALKNCDKVYLLKNQKIQEIKSNKLIKHFET
jgi:ABC-type bacteriocin/lantibiotic exporter with double-glycine peptidase domain